jgi:hypothetical protein
LTRGPLRSSQEIVAAKRRFVMTGLDPAIYPD